MMRRLRSVANWLNLSTPVGLAVARLGGAELTHDEHGLHWAEGYRLSFPMAGAFTVGNVIITASRFDALGPDVARHEERHTWQWALCGTLFLPLYVGAMGWSWVATGDRAAHNAFERRAGLVEGGYRDVTPRPWMAGAMRLTAGVRASGRSRAGRPSGDGGAPRGDDASA